MTSPTRLADRVLDPLSGEFSTGGWIFLTVWGAVLAALVGTIVQGLDIWTTGLHSPVAQTILVVLVSLLVVLIQLTMQWAYFHSRTSPDDARPYALGLTTWLVGLVTGIELFATLAVLLRAHDLVRGAPGVSLFGAERYFTWQALSAVPAVHVPETLDWVEPRLFYDHTGGAVLLLFDLLVLLPVVPVLLTAIRFHLAGEARRHAQRRDQADATRSPTSSGRIDVWGQHLRRMNRRATINATVLWTGCAVAGVGVLFLCRLGSGWGLVGLIVLAAVFVGATVLHRQLLIFDEDLTMATRAVNLVARSLAAAAIATWLACLAYLLTTARSRPDVGDLLNAYGRQLVGMIPVVDLPSVLDWHSSLTFTGLRAWLLLTAEIVAVALVLAPLIRLFSSPLRRRSDDEAGDVTLFVAALCDLFDDIDALDDPTLNLETRRLNYLECYSRVAGLDAAKVRVALGEDAYRRTLRVIGAAQRYLQTRGPAVLGTVTPDRAELDRAVAELSDTLRTHVNGLATDLDARRRPDAEP